MDFDKLVCVLASVLKGGNTYVLLLNFYMSTEQQKYFPQELSYWQFVAKLRGQRLSDLGFRLSSGG